MLAADYEVFAAQLHILADFLEQPDSDHLQAIVVQALDDDEPWDQRIADFVADVGAEDPDPAVQQDFRRLTQVLLTGCVPESWQHGGDGDAEQDRYLPPIYIV
jgi:hypothetical protein